MNDDKKIGLKPLTGAEKAVAGLEMRQKMIQHEKDKLRQLATKAERMAERGDINGLKKIEDEMQQRAVELTKLEDEFNAVCKQYGLA